MTRILSYNILVGGKRRVDQITKIISSAHPDIVGLVEANSLQAVEELADRLGMQYRISGDPTQARDWQNALLSHLPIVETHSHFRPDILTRPVLEVCLEEVDGHRLTVFVTHLAAAFYRGRGGESKRYRQNPRAAAGYPNLDFVVPGPLRFLKPLLRVIPRSKVLSALFDGAGSLYAPRGSIGMLREAGYIDCFRYTNPDDPGFTCPAAAPAGRIDYIFASPELAQRLTRCCVITDGNGSRGDEASDHLPVVAEFEESKVRVERPARGLATRRPLDSFDKG